MASEQPLLVRLYLHLCGQPHCSAVALAAPAPALAKSSQFSFSGSHFAFFLSLDSYLVSLLLSLDSFDLYRELQASSELGEYSAAVIARASLMRSMLCVYLPSLANRGDPRGLVRGWRERHRAKFAKPATRLGAESVLLSHVDRSANASRIRR